MEGYYEPDDVVYWKNGDRNTSNKDDDDDDNGWRDRLTLDWSGIGGGGGVSNLEIPPRLSEFPISVLSSWLQVSRGRAIQITMSAMRSLNKTDSSSSIELEEVIVYHYQQQMARLQLLTESHANNNNNNNNNSSSGSTWELYKSILDSLVEDDEDVISILSELSARQLSTMVSLRSIHRGNVRSEVWEGLVLLLYFDPSLFSSSWEQFTTQLLPRISTTTSSSTTSTTTMTAANEEGEDRILALQCLVILECIFTDTNKWDPTVVSSFLQQQQQQCPEDVPPMAWISLQVFCQQPPYYDNPWQYLQQMVFQPLFHATNTTNTAILPTIPQIQPMSSSWYSSHHTQHPTTTITTTATSSSMEVYYASILQDVVLSWMKVYNHYSTSQDEMNTLSQLFQTIYRPNEVLQQMAPIFWSDWMHYCQHSTTATHNSITNPLCDLLDATYTMAIASSHITLQHMTPFLSLVTCLLTPDTVQEVCTNMIPPNLIHATLKLCHLQLQNNNNNNNNNSNCIISRVLESICKLEQYHTDYVWQCVLGNDNKGLYWLSQLGQHSYPEAWYLLAAFAKHNATAVAQVSQTSHSTTSTLITHGYLYLWYQLALFNKHHLDSQIYGVMSVAYPYLTTITSNDKDDDCKVLAMNTITITLRNLSKNHTNSSLIPTILKALTNSTALRKVILQACSCACASTSNHKDTSMTNHTTMNWTQLWNRTVNKTTSTHTEEKKDELSYSLLEEQSNTTKEVMTSALLLLLEWARVAATVATHTNDNDNNDDSVELGPQSWLLRANHWQTWMDTYNQHYSTHRTIALLQCQLLHLILKMQPTTTTTTTIPKTCNELTWQENDVDWMKSQLDLYFVAIHILTQTQKEALIQLLHSKVESILFSNNNNASLETFCLVATSIHILCHLHFETKNDNDTVSKLCQTILTKHKDISQKFTSLTSTQQHQMYVQGDLCQIFADCFSTLPTDKEEVEQEQWNDWCQSFVANYSIQQQEQEHVQKNVVAYNRWVNKQLELITCWSNFCRLKSPKEWMLQPTLSAFFHMTTQPIASFVFEPVVNLLEYLLHPRDITHTLDNKTLTKWYQSIQRITTTSTPVKDHVLLKFATCSYSLLVSTNNNKTAASVDVLVGLGRLACQTYSIGPEVSLALLSSILLQCNTSTEEMELMMKRTKIIPTVITSLQQSPIGSQTTQHICHFLVILASHYPTIVLDHQIISYHLVHNPNLVEATQRWCNATTTGNTMRGYTSDRQIDPVHTVWCTVIRIVATLLRSARTQKDIQKRCVNTSMDFLYAFRDTFSSCFSSTAELTPSRLKEANDALYLISELCHYHHQYTIFQDDQIIHFFAKKLSYFLGAVGTARELFSALSKWNQVLGTDGNDTNVMEEAIELHPLLMDGIPNARHEALRHAHYAKHCCVCMTPLEYAQDDDKNNNDFQHHVTNDFTLHMEHLAATCIYSILSILQTTHPASSCFHYFDNNKSNPSILEKGMIVAFYHNNRLCYGNVKQWNTLKNTVDILSQNKNQVYSNIPFGDIVGMEDVSKRTCVFGFYPAPKFVSDNDQKPGNRLSVGNIILILRWCRQQASSSSTTSKNNMSKEMVGAIAEHCTLLLGTELSLHRELHSSCSQEEEETRQTMINQQLLEIYSNKELISLMDSSFWSMAHVQLQYNLQEAKQREEQSQRPTVMEWGGGHAIRNKSTRRSPFRMFSR